MAEQQRRASTGAAGLDELLGGGYPRGEMILVQGGPGTGKTTLGLQFALAGRDAGEPVLYITLSQTAAALACIARSHSLSLQNVQVHAVLPQDAAGGEQEQTIFHSAAVELGETLHRIEKLLDEHRPARLVLDTVAQLRLLASDPLVFRRHMLSLRQRLEAGQCTALLLDSQQSVEADPHLQDLAHGAVHLHREPPRYGDNRRWLSVLKMRAMAFAGGHHAFRIRTGGVEVFPRLQVESQSESAILEPIRTGVSELDDMLGGGLERGSACLIVGPPGTGKSSVAMLYAAAAAAAGEPAAVFLFDERIRTFLARADGLKLNVAQGVEQGLIHLHDTRTTELSPGEFAQRVRKTVEQQGARVVVIDSLTGYFHAMPSEQLLGAQVHELLQYLSQRGVLALLVVTQHGMLGSEIRGPLAISYMADSVMLLRHFYRDGLLRKAIAVLKKRHGRHDRAVRELEMDSQGLRVSSTTVSDAGDLLGLETWNLSQRGESAGEAEDHGR